MKTQSKKIIACLGILTTLLVSCKDLTELNVNPNGVQAGAVNPNLIMPTVLTETAKLYTNLGFQDIAGVVQHTQKDAWFNGHNDYDWGGDQSWTPYYDQLRNNELLYKRAVEQNLEFQQGVALVMKSYLFGLIADLWGDAPYTNALKGEQGGTEYIAPKYDDQGTIYAGILADLEKANTLLSKPKSAYSSIVENVDVYYAGDPTKWQKFANSLRLRYFMRISAKQPDIAKAGIEKIMANLAQNPIIDDASADATMAYVGNNANDAWPSNTVFDISGSNYRRIKMGATLVKPMQATNDPRLAIWAKKVEVPLSVDATLPAGTDKIVNGIRLLSPDKVGNTPIDTDPNYVGLPASVSQLPSTYNFNPTPGQTSVNPHVSYLNEIYMQAKGTLLKARLISAAEVRFILAEAAQKGWSVGDAKTHYEAGVRASLTAWGLASSYNAFIAQKGVAYDGTLAQVMGQKWIASWTSATESWFDYRRTGLPALSSGPAAKRKAIPLRFYYMRDELNLNKANSAAAIEKLEMTTNSQSDGKNSAWSKPWVVQGTGKPW
ncbi:SusD/RagB family nutrient-binding outer membrane lipoprotein [Rudanella paleaurantiibacter]|uniref:SusD/RagB family nutrient-binding outer membrane lipoprotein n=1 Tax=Rudanella paleaurantiibacter TaxID=2614655 RepID=A0A7J5U1M8_9BACT|nr:SusD/RagB family nutrient-binding outer membrane lipoprotein [Rudanella paleaurantiibacter]KAB7731527.1 SusD/RagB family nutrient-binding outer membrane lipoprotein [Rudanella paleaurantiibacter]